MKKTMLIAGIVLAALVVFGVGAAFAQGPNPYAGNGAVRPGASAGVQNGGGWMHDYVEQALAAKLGLTEAQVEEQFTAGKTMYQIALDNGIKQEDLTDFLNEVHQDAFAAAVKDGVITQEQANRMLQRMQNRGAYGAGNCPMHGGQANQGAGYGRGMMNGFGGGMMRGNWQNQQTNP
jgi:hypothetical protein